MSKLFKVFLFLFLLIVACTPEQRLNRLLLKHPELKVVDSMIVRDTIRIPGIIADTEFSFIRLHDTVFLDKGRLEVSMVAKNETLYVQGKCKADTIYKIHHIPVDKIRVIKSNTMDALIARIPWIVIGLISFLACLIFLFRKR